MTTIVTLTIILLILTISTVFILHQPFKKFRENRTIKGKAKITLELIFWQILINSAITHSVFTGVEKSGFSLQKSLSINFFLILAILFLTLFWRKLKKAFIQWREESPHYLH